MTSAAPKSPTPTSNPARDAVATNEAALAAEKKQKLIDARAASAETGSKSRDKAVTEVVEVEDTTEADAITDEKAIANAAVEAAKARAAKARSGTKTVLTSPLGAITSANTAITRLGGA